MNTKNFYQTLGKNLKHLRKQKGLTQEQFGEHFGLTKSAIVNYESGIRKIPADLLVQIANFHDVSLDHLICKKKTIADVIQSEIGSAELNDQEETVLVTLINYMKVGK